MEGLNSLARKEERLRTEPDTPKSTYRCNSHDMVRLGRICTFNDIDRTLVQVTSARKAVTAIARKEERLRTEPDTTQSTYRCYSLVLIWLGRMTREPCAVLAC